MKETSLLLQFQSKISCQMFNVHVSLFFLFFGYADGVSMSGRVYLCPGVRKRNAQIHHSRCSDTVLLFFSLSDTSSRSMHIRSKWLTGRTATI
ncbi:Oxidoreductase ptaL [Fusarium oxysporum f. sp. albedinis]|nr:Oxidoreductase ptaL [Fusarium oxysporum f. sp. albedinis]